MIYVVSEIVEGGWADELPAASVCISLSNFVPRVDLTYENEDRGMNQWDMGHPRTQKGASKHHGNETWEED